MVQCTSLFIVTASYKGCTKLANTTFYQKGIETIPS